MQYLQNEQYSYCGIGHVGMKKIMQESWCIGQSVCLAKVLVALLFSCDIPTRVTRSNHGASADGGVSGKVCLFDSVLAQLKTLVFCRCSSYTQ